jgi:hypothetical protein
MSGNHKYKDFHVTVLGPDPGNEMICTDEITNWDYHIIVDNYDQMRILTEFVTSHMNLYEGTEKILKTIATPRPRAPISDEMKPVANELIQELRRRKERPHDQQSERILQLLVDLAQEIEDQLKENSSKLS